MQKTKQSPLVSVIMNCYNGEKYLHKAINSVYAQTFENWEIIFWDNASTDSSAEIARYYDGKIRYFYTEKNTSLGTARVEAIRKASGEYLAFLDCDDVWIENKLEKQLGLIEGKPDIALVYSRCEVISAEDHSIGIIPERSNLYSGNIFCALVQENFIPFVSVLILRRSYDSVGGFATHYRNSTDYNLFLKLSYKYQIIATHDILCKYREHGENLSHSQYIICAEESIDSVTSFLPHQCAVLGMKYQYTQLVIANIKDKRIIKAVYLSLKYRVSWKVILRILKKWL